MAIFLALAPFGAFAVLPLLLSITTSLFASAAICLAIIAYDFAGGRSVKLLPAGSAALFVFTGCYIVLADPDLSISTIKLIADSGIFAIALFSLTTRRPFTLQYAREMVDAETAKLPGFMTANTIITWAWTAAFFAMAIANVLMIYVPGLPLWSGVAIAFAARNSAAYFTKWYPQHRREKLARQAGSISMVSIS